jgi:hypothetical protein
MRLKPLDSLRLDRPTATRPERAYFVSYAHCPAGHIKIRNKTLGKYEIVPRSWVHPCRWQHKRQQELAV